MGNGRWSRWGRGSCEGHTLEFGFDYRFDIRPGPTSDGFKPDFWYASARSGSLGQYPTFELAAQACEDEARKLIEPRIIGAELSYDAGRLKEQWERYLSLRHRLRSRRTSSRR